MRNFFCYLKLVLAMSSISVSKAAPTYLNNCGPQDSTFKDWYYTPTAVFGRTPLLKINGREFVRISRTKDQAVSVYKYNAAGILINTTDVKFYKGKISLITETNQWGENFDSAWFKPSGTNEFFVTQKLRGQNPYLPCKGVQFIYKNNLLQDMICVMDSTKPGYNQEGISHYKFERYN